jgi:hypothetical protein
VALTFLWMPCLSYLCCGMAASLFKGLGFFGEDEIPELSPTRVTRWQIQRMFEHHRRPKLPADFDRDV